MDLRYAKRAYETYKSCGANAALHIIDGGGHGFSKKHDVIAMEYLRAFAK